jgi:hypothetical protein
MAVLDHRLEQRLLALEVEVERALGDAGARRDVVEARRRKAALDKEIERRGHELARALVLAPAASRSRARRSGRRLVMGRGMHWFWLVTDWSVI